ncbi:hypothetical protein OB2597_06910 [Pseudooceanicola batsensis HTCC2597]|uniref:HEPN domain-containing protein n=1 Tax=Pseudooceanicola batsensis (strain ATCC BAA-863 / DSM 15984 / KCTC 12145 / HTCC2597) TaxID=252305 RepID=A3TTL7_PSEBH|nr:hypothetical protein [Pseudooceanicola batsensis]EAQ04994.1 hypothetical protein OB2597_06910 [Pseudooceanicola batsensis HTCC2597]
MSLFTDASPIGTFNYAHSFLGAAKALNRLEWEDRETHSDSPTEFVYWHSIELFLKAYLLADGMELAKLRSRDYGHNITALTAEAKKRGLALTSKDEELLSFMPSTEDMIDLRYLKVGVRTVPYFEEVEETCDNLYRSVGQELQKRGINIGFHAGRISQNG